MPIEGVEHRTIVADDGTSIAYQVYGQGPAVVFANGLGGDFSTWRHQYRALGNGRRIISWDYRGLFRSETPRDSSTYSLTWQARDLERILEAEGVTRALFCGWSMGVQVNFEYYRRRPEQFAGLVVLNGTAGAPFATAFGLPLMSVVVRLLVDSLRMLSPALTPLIGYVARWPGLCAVLKRLGAAAPSLDEQVFADIAEQFATIDIDAYLRTFGELGAHDARDVLSAVSVPALIVTGSKDFMTPEHTARSMAETIPNARYLCVDGATHYTAVEFPELVNRHLCDFVASIPY
ncbi:MAG: alpha/beta hydrolase [Deltaproteobacteria bacterium]|nr:alpha/beta hydrolase [Deltaproteobacteria bacterium]